MIADLLHGAITNFEQCIISLWTPGENARRLSSVVTHMQKKKRSIKSTYKKVLFAQSYILKGKPMSEALKDAGYSPTNTTAAWKALHDPAIRRYIVEILKEQQAQLSEMYRADKENIINELIKIAFVDPRRIVRIKGGKLHVVDSDEITNVDAAAIAEISETKKGIRIKFHNKVEALDKLAKILGLYVEKHEHTGKDGEPIKVLFNIPRPNKDDLRPPGDDETG